MIEIRNTQEAIDKLTLDTLPIDVLKDVLLQTFIFDTEFRDYQNSQNKVVILDSNEDYQIPDLIPEIDEVIEKTQKNLFILSDSGEGLVIYKKLREIENE